MMLSGTSGHNRMLRVERPKAVETVAWAAGNGNRSEIGDCIYGERRLREIDRRIRFLAKGRKAPRWSTRDSRSGATRYSSARPSPTPSHRPSWVVCGPSPERTATAGLRRKRPSSGCIVSDELSTGLTAYLRSHGPTYRAFITDEYSFDGYLGEMWRIVVVPSAVSP